MGIIETIEHRGNGCYVQETVIKYRPLTTGSEADEVSFTLEDCDRHGFGSGSDYERMKWDLQDAEAERERANDYNEKLEEQKEELQAKNAELEERIEQLEEMMENAGWKPEREAMYQLLGEKLNAAEYALNSIIWSAKQSKTKAWARKSADSYWERSKKLDAEFEKCKDAAPGRAA